MKFLIFLIVYMKYNCRAIYYENHGIIRENYVTLAAHFAADSLYKDLRLEVNELLGVPVMQVMPVFFKFFFLFINGSKPVTKDGNQMTLMPHLHFSFHF